ncbi:MAG: hypothetical protein M1829_002285 [Trizodia sp. TS-e1964]|nr:MAG: hypothetical protein M1829_002285 [Trizodia sp. TS-e1964]
MKFLALLSLLSATAAPILALPIPTDSSNTTPILASPRIARDLIKTLDNFQSSSGLFPTLDKAITELKVSPFDE